MHFGVDTVKPKGTQREQHKVNRNKELATHCMAFVSLKLSSFGMSFCIPGQVDLVLEGNLFFLVGNHCQKWRLQK